MEILLFESSQVTYIIMSHFCYAEKWFKVDMGNGVLILSKSCMIDAVEYCFVKI